MCCFFYVGFAIYLLVCFHERANVVNHKPFTNDSLKQARKDFANTFQGRVASLLISCVSPNTLWAVWMPNP